MTFCMITFNDFLHWWQGQIHLNIIKATCMQTNKNVCGANNRTHWEKKILSGVKNMHASHKSFTTEQKHLQFSYIIYRVLWSSSKLRRKRITCISCLWFSIYRHSRIISDHFTKMETLLTLLTSAFIKHINILHCIISSVGFTWLVCVRVNILREFFLSPMFPLLNKSKRERR
jgi:hypothetical protein